EVGFIEGRNVAIEYRFANNAPARLPELAEDLVRRRVSVIAASGSQAAVAAKGTTTTIPIIFRTGGDLLNLGVVTQFNKPGGNITGINDINVELGPKRLGLLHDLLPKASHVAMFAGSSDADSDIANIRTAASNIGMSVEPIRASTSSDIDLAFGSLVQ